MKAKAHLRILSIALLAWVAFLVAGLPDYYQQYSFTAMLAFSILLIPIIAVIGVKAIGSAKLQRRRSLAFWLAFYFTVPLAILDYLYCGLYLGHGLGFLSSYWYLTVFYIVPWMILVPIASWSVRRATMNEPDRSEAKDPWMPLKEGRRGVRTRSLELTLVAGAGTLLTWGILRAVGRGDAAARAWTSYAMLGLVVLTALNVFVRWRRLAAAVAAVCGLFVAIVLAAAYLRAPDEAPVSVLAVARASAFFLLLGIAGILQLVGTPRLTGATVIGDRPKDGRNG